MVTTDWSLPAHAKFRPVKMALAAALRPVLAHPPETRLTGEDVDPRWSVNEMQRLEAVRSQLLIEVHGVAGQLRSDLLELSSHLQSLEIAQAQQVAQVEALRPDLAELRSSAARAEELWVRLDEHSDSLSSLEGWDRWRLDALTAAVERHQLWLGAAALVTRAGILLAADKTSHSVAALRDGQLLFSEVGASFVHSDAAVMLVPAFDEQIAPSIQRYGHWARAEAEAILDGLDAGGCFVDVGAHTGYFGLLALLSRADVSVVFVEANPRFAALVERNLTLNGLEGLVLPLAAMDRAGDVFLGAESVGNPGDQRVYQEARAEGVWVRAARLDDELGPQQPPLAVVKTDCQGRDHAALRGMERVLRRDRPRLVCEFWPEGIEEYGEDPLHFLEWLDDMDYDVTAVDPGTPQTSSSSDLVALARSLPGGSATLLCLPRREVRAAALQPPSGASTFVVDGGST